MVFVSISLCGMKKGIPFLVFFISTQIGLLLGYFWRNYLAGVLLGFGVGLILMVLLRFILPKEKKEKEISNEEKQTG